MEKDCNTTSMPQKILKFEVGIEEVKEKVKDYFAQSAFEYKDYLLEELKPIYLPFAMIECGCEVKYDYYTERRYNSGHYLQEVKMECKGIIETLSTEIDRKVANQIDKYWDLSKLIEFDNGIIREYEVWKKELDFSDVLDKLTDKIKKEVLFETLGIDLDLSMKGEMILSENEITYILLPFYYAKINGLEILISGQSGKIAINSKEFLKTEKRLKFDKVLYSDKIQNNLTPIAVVIALLLVAGLAFISAFSEYIVEIFPSLEIVSSLIVIGVLIFLTTYFNNKKMIGEERYIKKIIYNRKSRLVFLDEVSIMKDEVNEQKKTGRQINVLMGCIGIIAIIGFVRFLYGYIFMFEERSNGTSTDWFLYLFIGAFSIYSILKIITLFKEKYKKDEK